MCVCVCVITYIGFVYLQILFYLTLVITSIKADWFHHLFTEEENQRPERKSNLTIVTLRAEPGF